MNYVLASKRLCITDVIHLQSRAISDGMNWGNNGQVVIALIAIEVNGCGLTVIPLCAKVHSLLSILFLILDSTILAIKHSLKHLNSTLSVKYCHIPDNVFGLVLREVCNLNTSSDMVNIYWSINCWGHEHYRILKDG